MNDQHHADLMGAVATLENRVVRSLHNLLELRDPEDQTIVISSATPYLVDYKNRRYIYMWATSSFSVSLEDLGTLDIVGGVWTSLNFPAGLRIYPVGLTSTANIVAFIRCTDDQLTQAPGIGYSQVSLFASNPTATGIATDVAVNWGAAGNTQVNHVLLANNTAISINYEFGAATTLGSDVLAAGQKIFFDIQTTALHLQAASSQAINGNNAGNIVVRGYL